MLVVAPWHALGSLTHKQIPYNQSDYIHSRLCTCMYKNVISLLATLPLLIKTKNGEGDCDWLEGADKT